MVARVVWDHQAGSSSLPSRTTSEQAAYRLLRLFQKSERAHCAAPPFQIEPASIWFWAQSRKKIDFNSLLQKERHALRVSLFGSCLLPQAKGGLWGGPAGILRERLRGHPLPMRFRWFHRTSPLKRQGRKRRLRSREQPSHGDFPQGGCFVMLRQKRGRGTDRRAAGLPGSLIWRR